MKEQRKKKHKRKTVKNKIETNGQANGREERQEGNTKEGINKLEDTGNSTPRRGGTHADEEGMSGKMWQYEERAAGKKRHVDMERKQEDVGS